ncbi:hypothetical protein AAVH_21375 [Aphelenchoides avenae]|nr:hypothetical protein AAVH_21375 [Aphelenchus avenae]
MLGLLLIVASIGLSFARNVIVHQTIHVDAEGRAACNLRPGAGWNVSLTELRIVTGADIDCHSRYGSRKTLSSVIVGSDGKYKITGVSKGDNWGTYVKLCLDVAHHCTYAGDSGLAAHAIVEVPQEYYSNKGNVRVYQHDFRLMLLPPVASS